MLWPILSALIAAVFLGTVLYQRSWIPYYAEAEPLYPTVEEFGRELVKLKTEESVSASDIRDLLADARFEAIHKYGVVFSDDSAVLVSIRINKRFSFDISVDGRPLWNKK